MKKTVLSAVFVLSIILVFSLSASAAMVLTPGYDVGDVTTSDIRAYIDGAYINSYNINGMTAVVAEDLRSYGFDVTWDGDSRTLIINRNPWKSAGAIHIDPGPGRPKGEKFCDILSSDIVVLYGTKRIPSFTLDGVTAVYLEDLTLHGTTSWDPNNKTISLTTEAKIYNKDCPVTVYSSGFFNNTDKTFPSWSIDYEQVYYDFNVEKIDVYDEYASDLPANSFIGFSKASPGSSVWLGTVIKKIGNWTNPYYKQELDTLTSQVTIDNTINLVQKISEAKAVNLVSQINQLSSAGNYEAAVNLGHDFQNRYLDYPAFGHASQIIDNALLSVCDKWRAAIKAPIAMCGYHISYNSIGIPEATICFTNISRKTITAFKASFDCYDGFGNSANTYSWIGASFNGYMQGDWLTPCNNDNYTWTLYSHDRTDNIRNIRITEVVFSDGTSWKR